MRESLIEEDRNSSEDVRGEDLKGMRTLYICFPRSSTVQTHKTFRKNLRPNFRWDPWQIAYLPGRISLDVSVALFPILFKETASDETSDGLVRGGNLRGWLRSDFESSRKGRGEDPDQASDAEGS
jgi:hypothetical protein